MLLGWWGRVHFFMATPTFRRVKQMPREEAVAALALPATKAAMLAEYEEHSPKQLRAFVRSRPLYRWHPSYEPAAIPPEMCLARVAERTGRAPQDVAYDWMCEENCEAALWSPMFGADRDGSLENTRVMLQDADCTPGFGDAGAHVTMLTDATAQTHMLTYWVRDRSVGAKIPLEAAVHAITQKNAALFGLADRGTLEVGKRADLNVIDLQRLEIQPPRFKHDLPTGAGRWTQGTSGYRLTLLHGEVTYLDGVHTGALPGGLVRGAARPPTRTLPAVQPEEYELTHSAAPPEDLKKHVDRVIATNGVVGPSAQGRLEKELAGRLENRVGASAAVTRQGAEAVKAASTSKL